MAEVPLVPLAATLTGDETDAPLAGLEMDTVWEKAEAAAREAMAKTNKKRFRKT